MAKRKAAPVGVATKTSEEKPESRTRAPEAKVPAPSADRQDDLVVTLPRARPEPGYVPDGLPSGVNGRLTHRQGAALKSLLVAARGLEYQTDTVAGTALVDHNYIEAIRWLLDQVADAWEEHHGEKLVEIPELQR